MSFTLCGTRLPDDYIEARTAQSATRDPGKYLYVKVVYIVVTDEHISLDRIKAQHAVINTDFNRTNPDIERVPTSGNYNYHGVVGESKIRFLPLTLEELTEDEYVKRVPTSQIFAGLDDVESFAGAHAEPNVINIYVAKLTSGLLGQAKLFSNVCVLNHRTVGGYTTRGDPSLEEYNQGRTATHELGHVLGLPHTFAQDGTSCDQEFQDIPAQKRPNFDAFLVREADGTYTGTLDNRFRDEHQPHYNLANVSPPYSCGGVYEMFFNFMDYGNDQNAIMFTKAQCAAMRQYLLSTNLASGEGPEVPPTFDVGELDPWTTTALPTEHPPLREDEGESLAAWVIAAIVLGSVLILALIVTLSVYYSH